jgi:glycosyltransferase involved in cell wall biosynthesis
MSDRDHHLIASSGRKILLISAYCPPRAPFGATRISALARFWHERGDDVRILAAANLGFDATEAIPLPPELVDFVEPGVDVRPQPSQPGARRYMATRFPAVWSVLKEARQVLHDIRQAPDFFVPWTPKAIAAGERLLAQWQPDVIYSTGPPHSCHIVAKALAKISGAKWIAELRDSWSDNPYMAANPLVNLRNQILERTTLSHASALVTVTEAERVRMSGHYRQPLVNVSNGFCAADIAREELQATSPETLTLIYAGALYGGRRDPRPLFKAIRDMGKLGGTVRVILVGDVQEAQTLMQPYQDIAGQIQLMDTMPREELLALYRKADVLLLLRWDVPAERNIVAGKLYEYIAVRKPILSIGCDEGEAAEIMTRHGFGRVCRSESSIRQALDHWLEQKRIHQGSLPLLPRAAAMTFTREEQFLKLDALMGKSEATVSV